MGLASSAHPTANVAGAAELLSCPLDRLGNILLGESLLFHLSPDLVQHGTSRNDRDRRQHDSIPVDRGIKKIDTGKIVDNLLGQRNLISRCFHCQHGIASFRQASKESRRIDQFKDPAAAAQPLDVALLGTLSDFAKQFHRLRLITWLAVVFRRNYHLDFNGNDNLPFSMRAFMLQPLAFDLHESHFPTNHAR